RKHHAHSAACRPDGASLARSLALSICVSRFALSHHNVVACRCACAEAKEDEDAASEFLPYIKTLPKEYWRLKVNGWATSVRAGGVVLGPCNLPHHCVLFFSCSRPSHTCAARTMARACTSTAPRLLRARFPRTRICRS